MSFDLQLRGLHVKNMELGLFQLGKSDPYFEIAKESQGQSTEDERWVVVYKSEKISDSLNPYWEPTTISLDELCNGDLDWPLKVTVFDWQRIGGPREIGSFQTTAQELTERISKKGNADRDGAFEIQESGDEDDSKRGFIVVLNAQVNEE